MKILTNKPKIKQNFGKRDSGRYINTESIINQIKSQESYINRKPSIFTPKKNKQCVPTIPNKWKTEENFDPITTETKSFRKKSYNDLEEPMRTFRKKIIYEDEGQHELNAGQIGENKFVY